jgi:hypothetical protein
MGSEVKTPHEKELGTVAVIHHNRTKILQILSYFPPLQPFKIPLWMGFECKLETRKSILLILKLFEHYSLIV